MAKRTRRHAIMTEQDISLYELGKHGIRSSLDPEDIYNIAYWGEGYFKVNPQGELEVCIPSDQSESYPSAKLNDILEAAQSADLSAPLLVRITNILGDRTKRLCHAFRAAFKKLNIEDRKYTAIYPIKVNQQKRVIQEILEAPIDGSDVGIGLEAGSKPEFIAALCCLPDKTTPLICNGYKDAQYLSLATEATELGYNITVVIEKISEIKTLFNICQNTKVRPKLGVRIRLHSTGKGNWQNTGGDKGKFGLTAPQLMEFLHLLSQHNWQAQLDLLHVHIGSQISDIQDLSRCLTEVARYYVALHKMGVTCENLDVGGGLGIDYEGTNSSSYHSINYNVEEYAQTVVSSIETICRHEQVPVPNLLTESGRALAAHHAILLANIVDSEHHHGLSPGTLNHLISETDSNYNFETAITSPTPLKHLIELVKACHGPLKPRESIAIYHQLKEAFHTCQQLFQAGSMDLTHKALAETYYFNACAHLFPLLDPLTRAHQPIAEELNELLSHHLFLNYSLFQSTPDIWGIGQIFPIMPITDLNEIPYTRTRLNDLTCDSDGRIDYYVDGMGIETTLPLPNKLIEKRGIVGIFLVGAYQEILGDLHNLFGDTNSVDITLTGPNQFTLSNLKPGDTAEQVLNQVNFKEADIKEKLEKKILDSHLDQGRRTEILKHFQKVASSSTYLK